MLSCTVPNQVDAGLFDVLAQVVGPRDRVRLDPDAVAGKSETPEERGAQRPGTARRRIAQEVVGRLGFVGNPEELSGLLGPVNFDLGVITGRRPLNPLTLLLPKPNDGKVTVEETRVSGMADFLVVPRGHTFIMNDHTVIEQVVHFLKQGRFARQEEARTPA